jgi:hypothetical protein
MPDKDPLVVISEILRKQDQRSEKLDEHTEILKQTRESLDNFIGISIQEFDQHRQQYQQQQKFNDLLLEALNKLNGSFTDTKEQQNLFNERFLDKLDDVERALKK